MLAQGDWVHWVLALITLGWLIAIADQARRYSAQFEESVRLRFENEDLIARLRQREGHGRGGEHRQVAVPRGGEPRPAPAGARAVAVRRGAASARHGSPRRRGMLDHIDSSVQAMGGLFNGLLDISRLDAGVVEVNAQTFAMQPLLERICRDYAGDAAAKQIELRLTADRAAAVYSDPLLVERIVRNIVANAIAYTDSGRVLVGCRRRGRSRARRGLGYRARHSDRGAGADIQGVLPGRKSGARSQQGRRPRPRDRQAADRLVRSSAQAALAAGARLGVHARAAVVGCRDGRDQRARSKRRRRPMLGAGPHPGGRRRSRPSRWR